MCLEYMKEIIHDEDGYTGRFQIEHSQINLETYFMHGALTQANLSFSSITKIIARFHRDKCKKRLAKSLLLAIILVA